MRSASAVAVEVPFDLYVFLHAAVNRFRLNSHWSFHSRPRNHLASLTNISQKLLHIYNFLTLILYLHNVKKILQFIQIFAPKINENEIYVKKVWKYKKMLDGVGEIFLSIFVFSRFWITLDNFSYGEKIRHLNSFLKFFYLTYFSFTIWVVVFYFWHFFGWFFFRFFFFCCHFFDISVHTHSSTMIVVIFWLYFIAKYKRMIEFWLYGPVIFYNFFTHIFFS